MKNKKIISAIALVLTIVVLQISGGSMILVAILGGSGISFLPKILQLNNIKKEKKYTITTTIPDESTNKMSYNINNQEFILSETNTYYEDIEFCNNRIITTNENNDEQINLIPKIETTPQLTQQENINRLVRKRKKETINRYKKNNI